MRIKADLSLQAGHWNMSHTERASLSVFEESGHKQPHSQVHGRAAQVPAKPPPSLPFCHVNLENGSKPIDWFLGVFFLFADRFF